MFALIVSTWEDLEQILKISLSVLHHSDNGKNKIISNVQNDEQGKKVIQTKIVKNNNIFT